MTGRSLAHGSAARFVAASPWVMIRAVGIREVPAERAAATVEQP